MNLQRRMRTLILKYKALIFLIIFLLALTGTHAQQDCNALIQSAIQAAHKKDYIKSLEILSQAKAIAENKNLPKQRFWILTNIGINHAEMLDYSEALDNFLEAYKIALKDLDVRSEMSIMNNIAGLYLLDTKYAKANEYFKKIYNYAKEGTDSLFIGGCAMNIVLTANQMKNIEEAENFLTVAYTMLQRHPQELNRAKSLKIGNLLQKGEYEAAEKLSLELLPCLKGVEYQDLKAEVLMQLVGIYRQMGNLDKAIYYAEKVGKRNINLESRQTLYDMLANLYYKKNNFIKAIAYKDSFIYVTDSLSRNKDKKHFENSRIKFELLKNEKELSDSQAKLKNIRIIFILSILMAAILIWAFINKSAKDKQRKKIVELELEQEKNNKLLLENKLKEQETLTLLEQERMKNEQEKLRHEIESKNKELTTKALFLANRNELVENILNSLSELHELKNNSRLRKNIRQLKDQLKENTEWDSFSAHFEQVNQSFITNLRKKHPNLTANEIRYLSLIYINLNTKEISSLLNITPEYCKKKKQQISQKLGLSSTTLLYNYLSAF